ncbi:cell wall-binding repeat-containing protein [Desulfosporosinus fructosivorans]
MKKTKKALASLAIAGMALSLVPFNAFAAGTVSTRLAGTTAEQTAVKIADQTGWTGTAILASSASYGAADALTAGPLAAFLKAPILLQGPGAVLNADTKAELTKLAVKKVYVTSGTAVISQAVLTELTGMGITVESLGGNDRFDTSVNIAKKMVELGAPVKKVAVAYGWLNQDALSIASVASAANEPIILTEKAGLSASAKAFLAANLGIAAADVIGGTGVIDATVMTQLPNATRHYGMSAYDTNSQVIQDFADALTFDNIFLANGVTGIDALSGAPLAAMTKSPIVLTDGVNVPTVAAFTFSKNSSAVVTALGGEAVVPETIRLNVAAGKVTPVEGFSIVSVSALNATNSVLEIKFSEPVSSLSVSDIQVKNAKTGARNGVELVTLSSDGKTAQVNLIEGAEDANVLAYITDYTITVVANGQTLSYTFNRPYFTEARVVDINVADREITVFNDDTGAKRVIEVLATTNFDFQAALGEIVSIWYNQDNELVKYEAAEKTATTDAIEISDTDEITLLSTDDSVDLSGEEYGDTDNLKIKFFLDGDEVDLDDGEFASDYVDKKYNYAKVGYDKSGDVEFISAYSLNDYLIVDSVDDDEIVGIDGEGTSGSFDAGDTTIVKGGKVIALADLKAGDVVFYNESADSDDGFAEVLNNTVTGEIEEVYTESIELDGETYQYILDDDVDDAFGGLAYSNAVYLDEDGETAYVDSDAAEELQAAGDVALYLDRAGNVVYISGDTAAIDTNVMTAVLTDGIELDDSYGAQSIQVEAILENEDEELYDITLEDLDTITINGEEYDIDNEDTSVTGDDYVVDVNDTTNVLSIYTHVVGNTPTGLVADTSIDLDLVEGQIVKVHLTDDGDVEELEFFTESDTIEGTDVITAGGLEAGDVYFKGDNASSKKFLDSTVVYDATDITGTDYDADDITVTTWGEYDGADIEAAHIIYNDDNEVEALVISETSDSSDVYEEAVITKVLRNADDFIVSVTAYVNGELVTIAADKIEDFEENDDLKKGDVAILAFNEDNLELIQGIQAASDPGAQYTARVLEGSDAIDIDEDDVSVGSKTVTVGNKVYKLVSDGAVLDASDLNDISEEGLADLRDEKDVTVVLDEDDSTFVKYFIYGLSDVAASDDFTATISSTSATKLVLTFSEALYVNGDKAATGDDIALAFSTTGSAISITSAIYNATAKTVTITVAGAANGDTIGAVEDTLADISGNAYDYLDDYKLNVKWLKNY